MVLKQELQVKVKPVLYAPLELFQLQEVVQALSVMHALLALTHLQEALPVCPCHVLLVNML